MSTTLEEIKTEAEAIHAVGLNPDLISKLPKKLLTKKVCDEAFRAAPYSRTYVYIPEKHRTFAMCLKACSDYGAETKDFAEGQLQPEWGISVSAFVALKKKGKLPNMNKVTDDAIKLICYKKAFANDASIIKLIPINFREKVLNKANVNSVLNCTIDTGGSFSSSLKFVGDELVSLIPEELMTSEKIAYFQEQIESNIGRRDRSVSIGVIPQQYMSDKLYELAIEKSASSLSSIPEGRITKKMCEMAVQKDGRVISSVPEIWREDFYLDVVKSGKGLQNIPEEDRTDRLCALAVEAEASQFEYVPEDKKSYMISLQAIDKNAEMAEFIPLELIDKEMMIRLIVSIFRNNWENNYYLNDVVSWKKERGQTEPVLKTIFDHYFEHPQGDYKRTDEVKELMHDVIKREGKLYFALMDYSGENDKNEGFNRFNSGLWKNFFEGTVRFEHAVTAARADIEVVTGFKQDVQARVWKEFLNNN